MNTFEVKATWSSNEILQKVGDVLRKHGIYFVPSVIEIETIPLRFYATTEELGISGQPSATYDILVDQLKAKDGTYRLRIDWFQVHMSDYSGRAEDWNRILPNLESSELIKEISEIKC